MTEIANRIKEVYSFLDYPNKYTTNQIISDIQNNPDDVIEDLCNKICDLQDSTNNLLIIKGLLDIIEELI